MSKMDVYQIMMLFVAIVYAGFGIVVKYFGFENGVVHFSNMYSDNVFIFVMVLFGYTILKHKIENKK